MIKTNMRRVIALSLLVYFSGASASPAQAGTSVAPLPAKALDEKAPCMVRRSVDFGAVEIRVSSNEVGRYRSLGYEPAACASDSNVAEQLGGICLFSTLLSDKEMPLFIAHYGVPISELCQSARRAGAELGISLDETDRRPPWAKEAAKAARANVEGEAK